MNTAQTLTTDAATWPHWRQQTGRFLGICLGLFFRLFYGLFFFQAGLNKIMSDWSSERLVAAFQQRLTELNPDSFASLYLENFALNVTGLIAFIVTWGELVAGIGLLLGIATRWSAALAFFILLNIAIGGYYDASLLPFFAMNIAFVIWPMGRKFGFDRYLHRRFPSSALFR